MASSLNLAMHCYVLPLVNCKYKMKTQIAWAGQDCFYRGGLTLTTFFFFFSVDERRGLEYHYKRAIIGPPGKRHLNGVSLAGRWWPNIEFSWLGSL